MSNSAVHVGHKKENFEVIHDFVIVTKILYNGKTQKRNFTYYWSFSVVLLSRQGLNKNRKVVYSIDF